MKNTMNYRNVRTMIKELIFIFAFILILPILHAEEKRGVAAIPLSPTGHQVRGNQWLFVIGINTYIDWPRLNTAVNDAKTIRDILLERYHFDKYHLIELYDEDATRKNILGKLRYLVNRVGPDDSVVIFYSGHGHLDSITKEGSWIPVESSREDISAWVSNHDIKSHLRIDAIKAKHILLISDSCFSGDFFRGHREKLPEVTDKVIKRAYELSSRQAITSGGLEPVVDDGFGGNSVFTYFLAKSLSENQKPFLIPSDFFPDIKAGVVENAEQLPRFGTLKDTGGQQGGELVFFLKQYGSGVGQRVRERQAELERLRVLERQSKAAREKEQAEIALKEEELVILDTKIKKMKERLGTTAANTNDSLDTMLAMVEDKENQAKRLEDLRRKREAKENKRLAEIEKLKKEQAKKRKEAIKEDILKYEKIVFSEYGRDMKKAAWNNLVSRYSEARGLAIGDINGLKRLYIEPELTDSFTKMKFILVEGGCFDMGDTFGDGDYDEKPVHNVCVDDFYIGKYEVTQGEWEEVMGNNPSNFKTGRNYPVETVSWDDVQDFIRSLNRKTGQNYRLPTEAEWEYAARERGKKVRFGTGKDTIGADEANFYASSEYKEHYSRTGRYREKTTHVKSFVPNSLGLHDMTGNVWEWCQDWYGEDYYKSSPGNNPRGASSGSVRVYRGGSWYSFSGVVRASVRSADSPDYRGYSLGFRLARTP